MTKEERKNYRYQIVKFLENKKVFSDESGTLIYDMVDHELFTFYNEKYGK